MNTKIGLSLLSILGAAVLAGGATFALFTTQASSTGNTFAVGDANLQIANDLGGGNHSTYGPSITGVNLTGVTPGATYLKKFWLKNVSSAPIPLDLRTDLANMTGNNFGTDGSLPNKLMVKFSCDSDLNGLGSGTDTTTGDYSVNTWITGGDDTLGSLGSGVEMLCSMTATLDVNAGNEVKGGDIKFDALFNGTQQASPSATPITVP